MDKTTNERSAKICVICGMEIGENEWGNNPWPIEDHGECCKECNENIVIPARIIECFFNKQTNNNK